MSTHYDAKHAAPDLPFDWSLLPQGQRALLAVSGGADSLALLWCLHQKRDIAPCNFTVAHVNHGLRGEESDEDEKFVVELCAQLEIPCVARRVEVAQRSGKFSEADARTARYAALLQTARENNCAILATGHTASDNLETVLLNFVRGASVEGMGGIKPQRRLAEIDVVRPLWQATRAQVQDALQVVGWRWRDDSSNLSTQYLRNRVRHELLPLLSGCAGKSMDALALQTARASQLWRDDIAWLDETARSEMAEIIVAQKPNLIALDGIAFRALPVALQRRVLREAVRRVNGHLQDIGSEQLETARLHIVADKRRIVWQWRKGLNVEWTGAMSGNRIRLWLVGETSKTEGKI